MEKKFKTLLSGAGKTAKSLIDQAVQTVDQNDDGKFDMSDVTAIAGTVGSAMKKGAQAAKGSAEETARQLELKSLQPIFSDSLDSADFLMPKFIRVVERDKKRAESEVCQGSIGYGSDQKGLHVVNIFRDSVDAFGLVFYPDCDCEFYYVDPSDESRYIALDEYFSHLKVARISELQKIAQDLGAKHFRISYMEERTSFSTKKAKITAKMPGVGTMDAGHEWTEKKFTEAKIEAENDFVGKDPVRPQVRYLQKDPNIQNLITMRLDENSPLLHQKFTLKLSESSGLKANDAVKIDAVLKGLKYVGNATVESEVMNESRRYLEYEIDF